MEQIALRTTSAPCKGCAERSPGCHGTCEKYINYRAMIDKSKADKDRTVMLADAKWQSICRPKRRKKGEK